MKRSLNFFLLVSSLILGRYAAAQLNLRSPASLADLEIPAPPPAAETGSGERKAPPLICKDKPAPRRIPMDQGSERLLATLDLTTLRNRLWRTAITTEMGGRTFYLSGEASDESNYHVVLTDEKSGKPTFLRELDLIMGYVDMQVAGQSYRVNVKPNLLDLYGSRLQISRQGGGATASFEIRSIMRAMFEAGEVLKDGEKTLRVHFTDQIFEGGDGRISRHGEPLLVLMVEEKDGTFSGERNRFQGDAVRASDLPSDGLLRTAFKIQPYGLFYLDLRRSEDGKTLEIFAPAP